MARKATPQEKAIYDRVVLQALRLLFDPKQAQQLESLARQNDPGEAVASVTVITIKGIMQAAQGAGRQLTPAFISPAAKEIMSHLVEMLVAFGVVAKEAADQVLQRAQAQFRQITGDQGQAQTANQPQQQGGMLAQGV